MNPHNKASALLVKIGQGHADELFASLVDDAINAVQTADKKATITLTVTIAPRDQTGALVLAADVKASLPKLAPPASQMHIGDDGRLLSQEDFLLGRMLSGGPKEVAPLPPEKPSASGRLTVAKAPAPAPLAPAPLPAPLTAAPQSTPVTGKDAAAKDAP